MTDPYIHAEMPPVIHRTADDHYRLEGQSGVLIAEYDQTEMRHPSGWWSEMITAMRGQYADAYDMAHDLTLLTLRGDWELSDDR